MGGVLTGRSSDSSNSSLAAAAGAAAPAADQHQQHLLYAPYHSSNVEQVAAGGQWTGFGNPAGSEAEQYQLQQQHDVMHNAATYHGYQMLPHDHHQQQPDLTHLTTDPTLPSTAAGFTSQLLNPSQMAAAGWQQQQQRSGGSSKRSSKGSKTTNPDGTPKPKGRSGPKSKFSPFIGVSQYKRTGRWEVGWLVTLLPFQADPKTGFCSQVAPLGMSLPMLCRSPLPLLPGWVELDSSEFVR
jgi:hypothetical protein